MFRQAKFLTFEVSQAATDNISRVSSNGTIESGKGCDSLIYSTHVELRHSVKPAITVKYIQSAAHDVKKQFSCRRNELKLS